MSGKGFGDGGEVDASCANLGRERARGTIPDDSVSTEDVDAVGRIAEIFVDDMLRLEREHGLNASKMLAYYRGELDLKDTD